MTTPPISTGESPPHLLIAEDDPASATMLRVMLQKAGYTVVLAPDGPAVLRLLEEKLPDVLLLDWMLPEMSGLEVCHRVRQRWDAFALPILMVTAKTDAESIYAAFDAGANDYITKPFRGAELRARIEAHLHTRRLAEERRRIEEQLRERDKLSSLGLLAGGVAHDLNNPLANISGYAQLLLRDEEDPGRADDLRRILREVERCRGIVGSLLGFARRRLPERRPVDLAEALRSVLELRERELRGAGVRPSLRLEEPLPRVPGDENQLQQVFLNIILNAEHALKNGGGTLWITAWAGSCPDLGEGGGEAGASEGAKRRICIDFFNDAPPIPQDVLPHIFDPFFTTKPKEEGTGLGLAVSQRIVRDHGGEISVQSDARGTVFRIRLPLAQEGEGDSTGTAEG
ncbi:MAG TPA: response regulator [Longimicrobiaceae bacterium]|nr:response regulator [Longimicrobiaceae bacterium]